MLQYNYWLLGTFHLPSSIAIFMTYVVVGKFASSLTIENLGYGPGVHVFYMTV